MRSADAVSDTACNGPQSSCSWKRVRLFCKVEAGAADCAFRADAEQPCGRRCNAKRAKTAGQPAGASTFLHLTITGQMPSAPHMGVCTELMRYVDTVLRAGPRGCLAVSLKLPPSVVQKMPVLEEFVQRVVQAPAAGEPCAKPPFPVWLGWACLEVVLAAAGGKCKVEAEEGAETRALEVFACAAFLSCPALLRESAARLKPLVLRLAADARSREAGFEPLVDKFKRCHACGRAHPEHASRCCGQALAGPRDDGRDWKAELRTVLEFRQVVRSLPSDTVVALLTGIPFDDVLYLPTELVQAYLEVNCRTDITCTTSLSDTQLHNLVRAARAGTSTAATATLKIEPYAFPSTIPLLGGFLEECSMLRSLTLLDAGEIDDGHLVQLIDSIAASATHLETVVLKEGSVGPRGDVKRTLRTEIQEMACRVWNGHPKLVIQ